MYCDIFRDKLLVITPYPGFVLIMFLKVIISAECLEIDTYRMNLVEIEH